MASGIGWKRKRRACKEPGQHEVDGSTAHGAQPSRPAELLSDVAGMEALFVDKIE